MCDFFKEQEEEKKCLHRRHSFDTEGPLLPLHNCNTGAVFIFSALFLSFRTLEVTMTGKIIRGKIFVCVCLFF